MVVAHTVCPGLGSSSSLSSDPSSSVVSSVALGAEAALEGWTSSFCPHPGGQGPGWLRGCWPPSYTDPAVGCLAPVSQSCRANVTVPSLPCAGHTRHSLCPANCFLHVPLTTVRVWGKEMIGLCCVCACACLPVCWLPLLFHWERVLPHGLSSSLHPEMCGHV